MQHRIACQHTVIVLRKPLGHQHRLAATLGAAHKNTQQQRGNQLRTTVPERVFHRSLRHAGSPKAGAEVAPSDVGLECAGAHIRYAAQRSGNRLAAGLALYGCCVQRRTQGINSSSISMD